MLDHRARGAACVCCVGLKGDAAWLTATVIPSYRTLGLIYWRGIADEMSQLTLNINIIRFPIE